MILSTEEERTVAKVSTVVLNEALYAKCKGAKVVFVVGVELRFC